jgi:UDP-N-acetylmuramate dehydrogenase
VSVIEQHQVHLAGLTTFAIGGAAARLISVSPDAESVMAGLELARDDDLFILGGGSNVLVADGGFDGTILRVEVGGQIRVRGARVEVGAGTSLDELVSHCAATGLRGFEMLAGIPGSVAGAIVQNAGAYGQHVATSIEGVTCVEVATRDVQTFDVDQCEFGYRSSVFGRQPGRWVVVSAVLRFEPATTCSVAPREVRDELARAGHESAHAVPLPAAIAAVRMVRQRKDHIASSECQTAGSFFKNVVMRYDTAEYQELSARFERRKGLLGAENRWVRNWTADKKSSGSTTQREIIAGSLIGTAVDVAAEPDRFRPGSEFGRLRLGRSGSNTIVNLGGALATDVLSLACEMRDRVLDVYQLILDPEVVFLGDIGM